MTTTSIDQGIRVAKNGAVMDVQEWLKSGGDPNRHDAEGWTPLSWACVRGRADVVEALLDGGADIALAHAFSGALPIHFAGHAGSVETARILIERRPDQLDAVHLLNGHTLLLQAVFYGHVELARFCCEQGANTAITTARGLGAVEMAVQFQNEPMLAVVRPFDVPAEAKKAYYASYLARIAVPVPPPQVRAQKLADRLVQVIADGLQSAAVEPRSVDVTLAEVERLVEGDGADVNRLAGPLQQPALIVAVTGNNGVPANADVARFRLACARYLLAKGADPARREKHPMAVQSVIRAAVFNHLDVLKEFALHMSPQRLADAINDRPVVNGLTAMHDTVLRATTAAPERFAGYLDQVRWLIQRGGRTDIEDFRGVTQRAIAEGCADLRKRERLLAVMDGKA